jgi:hypothetical protein
MRTGRACRGTKRVVGWASVGSTSRAEATWHVSGEFALLGLSCRYDQKKGHPSFLLPGGANVTRVYLGKPYSIRMYGGDGYAHAWERVYRRCIDVMADFRGWRQETPTWRRLARPYHWVAQWTGDRRQTPDTIEEMQRRGVYDADMLGL